MNKVLKNVAASALPQIVNIITNLILPGLIISRFGSDINGLVSTTKTIISYISLVGAGIAAAVTQALYKPVANNDDFIVKGMLKTANNMFTYYGFIFIGITLITSLIYPIFIHTSISYFKIACLLIVMSLSGASEFFAIGRCRALLYAHQKVYICSLIQAFSLILGLGIAVIMLSLNVGIVAVQFSVSVVYVLRGVFLSGYVRLSYPQYLNYKSVPSVKDAIQKRNDAMIHQLSGLAVTGSSAAILTFIVDLKAASVYSVYNIVLYGIRNICSNICTAVTPFLGKKYALNQEKELKKVFNAVEFVFFFFVTLILMVTMAMLISFVSLYTSGADVNYVFPLFAFLFVISSSFYILKLPGTALINVAGHFNETKWRAILEAMLSIVLSVIFTIVFGKSGVLIGTGIALCWRCIDTIIYTSKRILHCGAKQSVLRLLLSILNLFLVKILGLVFEIKIVSWWSWIQMSTLWFAVSLIVLTLEAVCFEKEAIKIIISFFKKSD